MALKYCALFFFLVVELRIRVTTAYSYSDSQKSMAIQNNVEVILNEQEEMEKKLDLLLKLQEADSDKVSPVWPPLNLLNASREVYDNTGPGKAPEIKYTLWYRNVGHDDDVSVLWTVDSWEGSKPLPEKRSEGVPDGEGKMWSTSAVVNTDGYHRVDLTVARLDLMLTYRLKFRDLNGFGKPNVTERNLSADTFEVLNDGDVVYDEDEDPVIKVKTHYVTRDPYDIEVLKLEKELINSESKERITESCDVTKKDEWYDNKNRPCQALSGTKKYRDGMEYEFKIKQPDPADNLILSGFTTLTVERDGDSSLLQQVQTQMDVVIRPRGQEEPYPDDFFELKMTGSGTDLYIYRYDSEVHPMFCEVRGNDLQEVKLVKQLPDGETEELTTAVEVRHHSHWMLASVNLEKPANVSTESNYTCVVTKKSGDTAEDSVLVAYSIETSIVKNETYAEINGTTVTAVCTARGYPLPDLSIMVLQEGWDYLDYVYVNMYDFERESFKVTMTNLTVERDMQNSKVKATGILENLERGQYDVVCSAKGSEQFGLMASPIEENDFEVKFSLNRLY